MKTVIPTAEIDLVASVGQNITEDLYFQIGNNVWVKHGIQLDSVQLPAEDAGRHEAGRKTRGARHNTT